MAKHKLLSGRVKVTPAANVTADRYEFLGLEQAEPSLGTASANGFVLTYNTNVTGNRLWAPGGLESNLAYAHANAAFNAANNAVDTWVRDAANSASSYANGAFAKANTANTLAQAAYDAANNAVDTWVRDAANSASSYANGAFVAANTADQRAVTSGDYANSSFLVANSASSYANGAFVAANTADQRAVTSGSYANSAFLVANSASSYANGAFVAANTADQRAVTSGDYANSSFLVANSASSYANGAFGSANSAGLYANAAFAAANLKYNSSGGTISGDVTITGNLTVEGNTLIVNVSTLSVEDSLIQLARNNITDAVDIGFLGHYNTGSGNVHAGLIRRASDDSFYLFDNLTTEPLTNVIDIANSSIATLRANLISSDVSIRGYDPINHTNNAYQVANSGSSYANSSYLHANAAFNAANNATDTWVRNAANSASSYANSGYIHANSAFDKANAGYNLINGAFGVSVTLDTFTGDSSCTTFSLNTTPSNENYTLIIIDGVTQLKSAYSLSGANVVFSEAPATNTSIEIVTFTSSAIQKVGVSITVDTFTGDSSCTAFTLSTTPKDENYITVTIDGLTQQKSAYSLSGTILTFTEAPSTNTSIEVTTFQSADEYAANTLSQTAFDKANSANVLAQAAFNAANNASDTWVRNAANAASSYANSAFGVANSASSYANGAFGVANTADQRAVTSGVYANSAYIHANAAFNAANNAVDTWVRDAANSASSYANGAFAKANSANVLAQTAFDAANNATDTWVRQAANSASSYANGAFAAANTADQKAVSAGSYANSSYLHANAAFNAANNATDTWVRNAANSASSYANSGYIHANSAFDKANAGYNLINSSFGVSVTVDNFTGDASCTTFSLSTTPVNENYTLITLNGITQHKSAYSLSGANVVFSEAPNTNVAIDVVTFTSSAIQKVGVSITLDTFTGDNSCTSFTLSSTPKDENYTMVSIDGVNQNKSAYSLSGAILTFSEAPGTSAAIEVTTFQSADEYASNTLSQLAFNKANSANILAQAAFDTANNATDTWVRNAANAASSYANSAFGVANSSSSYANGAFVAANTADQRAVTSGSYANSAYALANVKYDATGGTISGDVIVSGNLTVSGQTTYANSTVVNLGDAIITLNADIPQAFAPSENAGIEVDRGSSANVQLIWNETTDKWTFTNDGSSYSDIGSSAAESYANSAFAASNTADQRAVTSGTYANTAFGVANSASSYANGAFVAANTADQRAVTSGSYANSAYTQANTGVTNAAAASSYANSAFGVANSASSYANGAFVAANTADQRAVTSGTYSNSAFGVANSASSYANGAFAAANTADQRAVTSGDYANSAFSKANTANTLAQAAFDAANTGSSDSWARSSANAASSYANSAYLHANAAFNQANTGGGAGTDAYARAHANAAFEVANTATSGGERIYVASIDTFTSNGQNTVFTLSVTPPSTNSVMVYIDGVYQQTSAYTLSGTTLTMSEAVDANSTVQVRTFANTAVTDIGVTVNEFTGTGACTTFTLTTVPVSKNLTSIIVGGVPQMKSAYSISGSNVVFTAAPANNASIEVSTYKGGGSYATSFRSVVDTFTGDNSTTEFTLSTVPSTEKETFVYLNGVYQNKSTYSISGANVILTGTATSNDTIEVVTVAGSEMNVSSSRYNSRVYTANGSQTAFTISSGHSANSVLVFENGICQEPITDYTVSGTTLTFTTAPAANVKIQIRELPV